MKKLAAIICGILFLTQSATSATDPAIDFVHKLADEIITDVLAAKKPMSEKLNVFRDKFQNALDLRYIGQFVLGVYWRKSDENMRDEFLDAFMEFTTKSWADKFNMYQGQKIVFNGVRNAQKGQLFVDSVIQNNPPVEVVWRIREKDGTYKIVDIIVEGVSMAMSYRNEYAAFLQTHNGDLYKLIDTLKSKSKEFKFTEVQK
ncbi:MAG: ABC transporter substrate-binding protein [Alphaproteobacteria bacterium]|nr:ABC transporter substrate-binding protein [Alphaproteobacteria bacterium]